MSTATTRPDAADLEPSRRSTPPLENGDRLTRAEFERRYDAMPELKKAELIDGVVYMPSPVRLRKHGQPHYDVITWMGVYRAGTPGVLGADNASVRLDPDNMPQPDVLMMIDPSQGGRARISEDDYVEGAPELVVEVASSSASYDLHAKLDVYRRYGVAEYLLWRVLDRAIDWYVLREGRFEPMAADDRGRLRSEIFPGLWLDAEAILRGDLSAVLEAAREGLASPGHAAFLERLRG